MACDPGAIRQVINLLAESVLWRVRNTVLMPILLFRATDNTHLGESAPNASKRLPSPVSEMGRAVQVSSCFTGGHGVTLELTSPRRTDRVLEAGQPDDDPPELRQGHQGAFGQAEPEHVVTDGYVPQRVRRKQSDINANV